MTANFVKGSILMPKTVTALGSFGCTPASERTARGELRDGGQAGGGQCWGSHSLSPAPFPHPMLGLAVGLEEVSRKQPHSSHAAKASSPTGFPPALPTFPAGCWAGDSISSPGGG